MSMLASTIFGCMYVLWSVYIDSVSRSGDPIYSIISETVLWVVFYIFFVGFWKFYCVEWKKLSDRSFLRVVFERIWLPLVTVFLVTNTNHYESPEENYLFFLVGLALFLSLTDMGASIEIFVKGKFSNLNSTNRSILYSQYPPKLRSDLLPMDLIVNIMIVIMIIKKVT